MLHETKRMINPRKMNLTCLEVILKIMAFRAISRKTYLAWKHKRVYRNLIRKMISWLNKKRRRKRLLSLSQM